jgi:hypothetical protein
MTIEEVRRLRKEIALDLKLQLVFNIQTCNLSKIWPVDALSQ